MMTNTKLAVTVDTSVFVNARVTMENVWKD